MRQVVRGKPAATSESGFCPSSHRKITFLSLFTSSTLDQGDRGMGNLLLEVNVAWKEDEGVPSVSASLLNYLKLGRSRLE